MASSTEAEVYHISFQTLFKTKRIYIGYAEKSDTARGLGPAAVRFEQHTSGGETSAAWCRAAEKSSFELSKVIAVPRGPLGRLAELREVVRSRTPFGWPHVRGAFAAGISLSSAILAELSRLVDLDNRGRLTDEWALNLKYETAHEFKLVVCHIYNLCFKCGRPRHLSGSCPGVGARADSDRRDLTDSTSPESPVQLKQWASTGIYFHQEQQRWFFRPCEGSQYAFVYPSQQTKPSTSFA